MNFQPAEMITLVQSIRRQADETSRKCDELLQLLSLHLTGEVRMSYDARMPPTAEQYLELVKGSTRYLQDKEYIEKFRPLVRRGLSSMSHSDMQSLSSRELGSTRGNGRLMHLLNHSEKYPMWAADIDAALKRVLNDDVTLEDIADSFATLITLDSIGSGFASKLLALLHPDKVVVINGVSKPILGKWFRSSRVKANISHPKRVDFLSILQWAANQPWSKPEAMSVLGNDYAIRTALLDTIIFDIFFNLPEPRK